jgi:hypothetical protein
MKEYRILKSKLTAMKTEYELNKLARDGWEVVNFPIQSTWILLERIKK